MLNRIKSFIPRKSYSQIDHVSEFNYVTICLKNIVLVLYIRINCPQIYSQNNILQNSIDNSLDILLVYYMSV